MYQRARRKMDWYYTLIAILIINIAITEEKSIIDETHTKNNKQDILNNDIIDFESAYDIKYNKRYGSNNYNLDKDINKYTLIKKNKNNGSKHLSTIVNNPLTTELNILPLEFLSTTENPYSVETTTDLDIDLTVIPLSTTKRTPATSSQFSSSTQNIDDATENIPAEIVEEITSVDSDLLITSTTEAVTNSKKNGDNAKKSSNETVFIFNDKNEKHLSTERNKELDIVNHSDKITKIPADKREAVTEGTINQKNTENPIESEYFGGYKDFSSETKFIYNTSTTTNSLDTIDTSSPNQLESNSTVYSTQASNSADVEIKAKNESHETDKANNSNDTTVEKPIIAKETNETLDEQDVPLFTELDIEEADVPEDFYDSKDVVPTKPPNTDALSLIFGLAGSVVESVAEKVVPKGIFDLFKRMQKQSEALEAERLRSREENGGIGQFGRGILKSISSGLSKPLNQLMAGAKDIGSLDSDRGFVSSVATGVSNVANVANSVLDAFKNRVQAIYPGTLWCGDGHSAQARSSDLGLFFFTDTCCRQHDACKIYIKAGETKYGLTNTGLFTRSHCGCDAMFRECLQKTNSLISSQIGITYFNVLGPQCFRKAHPIVKCVRRTRITGQKCEEYELDYTKPRMWQWFDSETF